MEPWSGCSLPVGDERGALGDLAHLHWSALSAGMDAVKPEVDACRVKYGVAGTAVVKVRIAVDGSVRSAEVISPLTGTPTAACVEAAVKTARFVPSKGLVTSYPFQLR